MIVCVWIWGGDCLLLGLCFGELAGCTFVRYMFTMFVCYMLLIWVCFCCLFACLIC